MKTKSAWLVTWEWIGDHAAVVNKVAAVADYRKSPAQVRSLVEQLYISKTSSAVEMAIYAKDPSENPYPAHFHRTSKGEWRGRIDCGHNPFLYARKVINVRSVIMDDEEILRWEEIPIPRFPD